MKCVINVNRSGETLNIYGEKIGDEVKRKDTWEKKRKKPEV